MPKVVIDFEVKQSGASVKQIAGEAEVALERLKKSAGNSTEAIAKSSRAVEQQTVSMRDTKQAIGALSMAFGQFAPQATYGALEVSKFAQELRGLPLVSKAMSIGMVAAGAAIAGLLLNFRKLNKFKPAWSPSTAPCAVSISARSSPVSKTRSFLWRPPIA